MFENALSQLVSLIARLISLVFALCNARSLVNKVVDTQYLSLIWQKLSDDDNLDAVKSVYQSQFGL